MNNSTDIETVFHSDTKTVFHSDIGTLEVVLESFILSIICLVAVVANVSLWLIVLTTRDLRNESNILILCLSFADLLVSSVSMPITIFTIITEEWRFSGSMCTAMGYINMLTFTASVQSLGAIGINRYIKICRPSCFIDVYTVRNVLFMSIGVWLLSGTLSVPPLLGWAVYSYLPNASICFCDWTQSVSYALFMIGACFGGPCSIMTFCYVRIIRTFLQSRKTLKSFAKKQSSVGSSIENLYVNSFKYDKATEKMASDDTGSLMNDTEAERSIENNVGDETGSCKSYDVIEDFPIIEETYNIASSIPSICDYEVGTENDAIAAEKALPCTDSKSQMKNKKLLKHIASDSNFIGRGENSVTDQDSVCLSVGKLRHFSVGQCDNIEVHCKCDKLIERCKCSEKDRRFNQYDGQKKEMKTVEKNDKTLANGQLGDHSRDASSNSLIDNAKFNNNDREAKVHIELGTGTCAERTKIPENVQTKRPRPQRSISHDAMPKKTASASELSSRKGHINTALRGDDDAITLEEMTMKRLIDLGLAFTVPAKPEGDSVSKPSAGVAKSHSTASRLSNLLRSHSSATTKLPWTTHLNRYRHLEQSPSSESVAIHNKRLSQGSESSKMIQAVLKRVKSLHIPNIRREASRSAHENAFAALAAKFRREKHTNPLDQRRNETSTSFHIDKETKISRHSSEASSLAHLASSRSVAWDSEMPSNPASSSLVSSISSSFSFSKPRKVKRPLRKSSCPIPHKPLSRLQYPMHQQLLPKDRLDRARKISAPVMPASLILESDMEQDFPLPMFYQSDRRQDKDNPPVSQTQNQPASDQMESKVSRSRVTQSFNSKQIPKCTQFEGSLKKIPRSKSAADATRQGIWSLKTQFSVDVDPDVNYNDHASDSDDIFSSSHNCWPPGTSTEQTHGYYDTGDKHSLQDSGIYSQLQQQCPQYTSCPSDRVSNKYPHQHHFDSQYMTSDNQGVGRDITLYNNQETGRMITSPIPQQLSIASFTTDFSSSECLYTPNSDIIFFDATPDTNLNLTEGISNPAFLDDSLSQYALDFTSTKPLGNSMKTVNAKKNIKSIKRCSSEPGNTRPIMLLPLRCTVDESRDGNFADEDFIEPFPADKKFKASSTGPSALSSATREASTPMKFSLASTSSMASSFGSSLKSFEETQTSLKSFGDIQICKYSTRRFSEPLAVKKTSLYEENSQLPCQRHSSERSVSVGKISDSQSIITDNADPRIFSTLYLGHSVKENITTKPSSDSAELSDEDIVRSRSVTLLNKTFQSKEKCSGIQSRTPKRYASQESLLSPLGMSGKSLLSNQRYQGSQRRFSEPYASSENLGATVGRSTRPLLGKSTFSLGRLRSKSLVEQINSGSLGRSLRPSISQNIYDKRRKEEFQLSVSLLVVVLIFTVCWFPYCVSMLVSIVSPHLSTRSLDMTALLLGYLNSCVNPIVYGIMNKKFKAGYKKLFESCLRPFRSRDTHKSDVGAVSRRTRPSILVTGIDGGADHNNVVVTSSNSSASG